MKGALRKFLLHYKVPVLTDLHGLFQYHVLLWLVFLLYLLVVLLRGLFHLLFIAAKRLRCFVVTLDILISLGVGHDFLRFVEVLLQSVDEVHPVCFVLAFEFYFF